MAVIDSSPDESTVLVLAIAVLLWKAAGTNSTKDKLPALAIWGTKSMTLGDRLVVVVELPPSNTDLVADPVTEYFAVELFIDHATNSGAAAESAGTGLLLLLLMLWILFASHQ
jgi:hypothetical protein